MNSFGYVRAGPRESRRVPAASMRSQWRRDPIQLSQPVEHCDELLRAARVARAADAFENESAVRGHVVVRAVRERQIVFGDAEQRPRRTMQNRSRVWTGTVINVPTLRSP